MLAEVRDLDPDLLLAASWTEADLAALLHESNAVGGKVKGDPDEVPDSAPAVTKVGDVWTLGRHRLMCGDSTVPEQVARLCTDPVDAIITDPPYSSGGFQESSRRSGSIGTDASDKWGGKRPEIANDKLSSRGYTALMKSVLSIVPAPILYVFTDWRMWVHLYDVAESSGFLARSMIVWDKGNPGMGLGWRTQHELVLFAARDTVKFDNHKAIGNVLRSNRTGNLLHPTQKPVDIIESVLAVTDMAATVYDPFGGSGTTLIACEQQGRTAYLMELTPGYCDVICRRYQRATGVRPILEATGEAHDFDS